MFPEPGLHIGAGRDHTLTLLAGERECRAHERVPDAVAGGGVEAPAVVHQLQHGLVERSIDQLGITGRGAGT